MSVYSSFPKNDRIKIRLPLASAWAFTALAGGGGVLLDLGSIAAQIGAPVPFASSLIVFIFSGFATVGVLLDRYWIEWAAAWFVAGGIFVYTVIFWVLVFTGQAGRFQTAGLLSALFCFYVYRIVACAAHAHKQRTIHNMVQSGEVRLPHA